MNERACVPIKLYSHKQLGGRIWPTGCSLPAPGSKHVLNVAFCRLARGIWDRESCQGQTSRPSRTEQGRAWGRLGQGRPQRLLSHQAFFPGEDVTWPLSLAPNSQGSTPWEEGRREVGQGRAPC